MDTACVWADELPQSLLATTVILPPVGPAVALRVSVEEPPDQPLGRVQVYEVAPATGEMVKVPVLPSHKLSGPLMVVGVVAVGITYTANVCAVELPQLLSAVTLMLPPVAPEVGLIEILVEVPDQPLGNVHV